MLKPQLGNNTVKFWFQSTKIITSESHYQTRDLYSVHPRGLWSREMEDEFKYPASSAHILNGVVCSCNHPVLEELKECFWEPFVLEGGSIYYVKSSFDLDKLSYTFVITDLIHLWFRCSDRTQIQEEQQVNPFAIMYGSHSLAICWWIPLRSSLDNFFLWNLSALL